MNKSLTAFILPLLLFSCLSSPQRDASRQDATTDAQVVSGAMAFEPSADALFFRFDLVRNQKKEYRGGNAEPTMIDDGYAVFGCYLGDGLTVDSNGNVYLDPIKLFAVDPKGQFKMKRGQESIERTGEGYKMRGFREGVLQSETATLNDRGWIKVNSGISLIRNLQLDESGKRGVCARGLEKDTMSATEKEIRVSGGSSGQSAFSRYGSIVEFQGPKKLTIEQRGDAYKITVTEMFFMIPQGATEYELSFLDGRIVFKRAGKTVYDLAKRSDGLYDSKSGAQLLSVSLD